MLLQQLHKNVTLTYTTSLISYTNITCWTKL